ncbi:MAG: HAD family phosphatase [Chloroflexi bacterium]|nr:HAD family phosphatase [Chloroflexota bacterium]
MPENAPLAAEVSRPKIEMVVIDIDGTLLNSESKLTPRVETAVKTAAAQGVKIVVATGKTRNSMRSLLERLGVATAGIYVQGTVLHEGDGSITHQVTLPDTVARQVITFAEERGFIVSIYSGSRILLRAAAPEFQARMRHYHEVEMEIVGPLQNQIGRTPINKIIAVGDPKAVTSLRWQLNLQIGATARVLQAGVPTMLEVLPIGVSKGSALKRLSSDLRVRPEHIMAIGDAENDIEMLPYAGLGVAMGHAEDRVKSAAKHVVASNDQDGVAEALERWVIVKPPEPAAPSVETPTAAPAESKPGSPPVEASSAAPEVKTPAKPPAEAKAAEKQATLSTTTPSATTPSATTPSETTPATPSAAAPKPARKAKSAEDKQDKLS